MTVHASHLQHPANTLMVSASGSRPRQMPHWMFFFLQIGATLAEQSDGEPITAAIISPTREFAALAAAIGVVRARKAVQHVLPNQFEDVWSSDQQLTVRFILSGKELRGRVIERVVLRGERFLRLELTTKRSETITVPERSAHNLAVLQEGSSRRAKAAGITDPWLAKLLEGCDEQTYLLADRFDCLLVGRANQLRDEADLGIHVTDHLGKLLSGTVHCALRVKRWQSLGSTFSSDVISDRSDPQDSDLEELRRFNTVIFDGSTAYLRWHGRFSGQHHLVVLHHSDRRLEEAVNGLDQEFRLRAADWKLADACPVGMEFISFGRRA